ncbi:MAG: hypothetical protein AAGA20_05530 [Planctomycetota bacterium]
MNAVFLGAAACAVLGLGASCASTPPPPPIAVDEVPLREAIDGARAAIRDFDLDGLRVAAQQLALVEPASNADAAARDYWRGAALFNAVLVPRDDDGDVASATSAATDALEETVARRESDPESHAMLATLIGRRIKANPFSAITLGSAFKKHRKASADARSTNPRVAYLEGVGRLKRAGDPDAVRDALDVLLDAERLFALEAQAERGFAAPDWGRGHNLMFIGEAHERLGEIGLAADAYERAIEASPELERAQDGYRRCRNETESVSR